MAAKQKKRANAFEDFPVEGSEISPEEPGVSNGPFGAKTAPESLPQVERIERLMPSQMIPDRFQPRRLLPPSLRKAFFGGELDCYGAAEKWIELSHADLGIHQEIERLLNMGSTFKEHGQIKPITGTWVPANDGSYIFQIETGERRFWAACLQTILHQSKDEPLLRVEVVAQPTRQRQVLENRHAEPPSSVEQACEVASLILAELGIAPAPDLDDDFEYFRQARAQRMPAGLWDKIMPVMQLTRPRMVQLLNILQLPSQLLDLADRYRLPERVLREVLSLPRDQWERMLRISVQSQLTSEEVAEYAVKNEGPYSEKAERHAVKPVPEPAQQAMRYLKRFANILDFLDEISRAQALDIIADDLIVSRRGQAVQGLLDELGKSLDARLSRM